MASARCSEVDLFALNIEPSELGRLGSGPVWSYEESFQNHARLCPLICGQLPTLSWLPQACLRPQGYQVHLSRGRCALSSTALMELADGSRVESEEYQHVILQFLPGEQDLQHQLQGYVLMRRPGGILLAIPDGIIEEEALVGFWFQKKKE